MKFKLLALLLASYFFVAPDSYMSKEEAEDFVRNGIYKSIEKTVNVDKKNLLEEQNYIEMYGRDNNGRPLYLANPYPNDIYILEGNKGDKSATPEFNIFEIVDFVDQHNVRFKFDVRGSNYTGPKLKKNESEQQFADVYVRKEWTVDGKTIVIFDTVTVNLKDRSIPVIHNGIMTLKDIPEETLDGMMAKAAGLYSNDKYKEAIALYQKVLKDNPNDGDAWYNLGVLYFKNQGVGNLSRKQRLQKAYECWKKSDLKKACRAISYITDGREGC